MSGTIVTDRWAGGRLLLTFPAPTIPLSINEAHRLHWAARRKRTDPWRDIAILAARQAVTREGWTPTPVTIRMELEFRKNARRDPHNYVGTVVKAVVDGLVTGGIIPDDTPEWATIGEPRLALQADPSLPLRGVVLLIPRSNQ